MTVYTILLLWLPCAAAVVMCVRVINPPLLDH
jgi:hypothetical protein